MLSRRLLILISFALVVIYLTAKPSTEPKSDLDTGTDTRLVHTEPTSDLDTGTDTRLVNTEPTSVQESDEDISTDKFIRFECVHVGVCGGWADRLKGIISTYALSLILKRKFLMEITQPCQIANLIKPKLVNWSDERRLELAQNKADFKQFDFHFQWDLKKYDYFASKDLIGNLDKYDLITIRTGLNLVNSLAANPLLEDSISSLGYNVSQFKLHYLLHDFYDKLFKLDDRLERLYESYKRKLKPNPTTKLVCAQIRIGGGDNDDRFADLQQSTEFWKFIDGYLDTRHSVMKDYMIYVTSDKEEVKKQARERYRPDKLFMINDSSVHMDKQVGNLGDNCSAVENVILDFHLLQHCDVAVVSHSGFGILGAWNRPNPNQEVYVFTNQDAIKKNYWDRKNLWFVKVDNFDDFFFH